MGLSSNANQAPCKASTATVAYTRQGEPSRPNAKTAKGEKAPGYEEPQTVRETSIRALNADEREALRDVVEGRVTFEDFERRFDESEPTP